MQTLWAEAAEPVCSGSCLLTSPLSPAKLFAPLLLWLLVIISNNAINSPAMSMDTATPGMQLTKATAGGRVWVRTRDNDSHDPNDAYRVLYGQLHLTLRQP